jgi:hypothetical protein
VRGGNGPKETTCRTTEKKRVKFFLSVDGDVSEDG